MCPPHEINMQMQKRSDIILTSKYLLKDWSFESYLWFWFMFLLLYLLGVNVKSFIYSKGLYTIDTKI